MFFSRSTFKFLGILIFFSSSLLHARYGLGLWAVGGADVGGAFLSSNIVNPPGSSVNATLKEQDKSGLLYNVKGGLSWYISSVFALDILGGWSSVDVVGKAPTGGKAVEIRHNLAIAEVFPRFRFGDLGRWQLGPLYRGYFGSNTGFSENINSSASNRSPFNYVGVGFNYDIRSATEKTLYRVGVQALADMSDPRSIYMGGFSFQFGFDLFGSGDESEYSMQPEFYPGEEVRPLPVIHRLPVIEEGISVRESEPMPLKDEFNEMPIEKAPPAEAPLFQDLQGQTEVPALEAPVQALAPIKEEVPSVVIQLPADSFQFASGMSHIGSSKSREYLQGLGAFLGQSDQSFQSLVVVGHTDKRGPKGREREVNLELSQARAKTVYEALVAGGARAEKLRFEGKAFDEPIEGALDNPKDWKLNRRVELSLKAVSDPSSMVEGINQLNEKFGIKQKATIKR